MRSNGLRMRSNGPRMRGISLEACLAMTCLTPTPCRGGMILSNDAELGKKINSAVFPGLQGGPLMHTIAAKAVAFGEVRNDEA